MPEQPYHPQRPLVIVCCHAIFIGTQSSSNGGPDCASDPYNESNWLLKPFQRGSKDPFKEGEHVTFIAHISRAVQVAKKLEDANPATRPAIIFSGGPTEMTKTTISEAQGYNTVYNILYPADSWPVLIEDRATDSFQNILFSLLKYRQELGHWPDHISIVTHAFKTRRMMDLHLKALKWPKWAACLEGIDPAFSGKCFQLSTTTLVDL